MNLDKHLNDIRVDGYTILEHLLPDASVARIKQALSPYLQRKKMGRNDFEGLCSERVYALLAKAPEIAEIIEHPTILALVDEFLTPNYLLSAALAINVHPGETPQRFHSDDSAASPLLARPRPMVGVSTIWAFDDFTENNGATEVIPGSHLWDESVKPCERDAVQVVMPAGSVVVFAGTLYHRGGANTSNNSRLGITPQYCMPWLRQLENMSLAVPPQVAAQYSERIQELLGYSIIDPGFMGFVNGMHPKRLIDPDYIGRKYRADLPNS